MQLLWSSRIRSRLSTLLSLWGVETCSKSKAIIIPEDLRNNVAARATRICARSTSSSLGVSKWGPVDCTLAFKGVLSSIPRTDSACKQTKSTRSSGSTNSEHSPLCFRILAATNSRPSKPHLKGAMAVLTSLGWLFKAMCKVSCRGVRPR